MLATVSLLGLGLGLVFVLGLGLELLLRQRLPPVESPARFSDIGVSTLLVLTGCVALVACIIFGSVAACCGLRLVLSPADSAVVPLVALSQCAVSAVLRRFASEAELACFSWRTDGANAKVVNRLSAIPHAKAKKSKNQTYDVILIFSNRQAYARNSS